MCISISITYNDFFEYFQPIVNASHSATVPGVNGQLFGFEMYGADLAHVQAVYRKTPDCVWTVLDVEGELIMSSGFHVINRMAYLISSIPCPSNVMVEVREDPPTPSHRLACFAQYNGVSTGIQAVMDAFGNETFESYPEWLNRMLNTWSADSRFSRHKMTPKHYALFDIWLGNYVSRQRVDLLLAA